MKNKFKTEITRKMTVFFFTVLIFAFTFSGCQKSQEQETNPNNSSGAPGGQYFYVWNLAWNSGVDAFPNVNCINAIGNSFATLNGTVGGSYSLDYSASGNWQIASNSTSYTLWNNFARAHTNTKILLTFGGGSNDFARDFLVKGSASDFQNVANLIANDVKKYYLQGVDLNIEGWWSYTNAQNVTFAKNLITFVANLRTLLPGYVIMVSQGINAVGPIGNISSSYDGSFLPFLNDPTVAQNVDFINIEAYQTGYNNFYDLALVDTTLVKWGRTNFPKSKILFGYQSQDNDNAGFYSSTEIQNLAAKVASYGFGGMSYWGRGYGTYGKGIYSPYYMQPAVVGLGGTWQ